ncbi:MAG: hypothetical protein H7255_09060 [Ramlibacter sp.]|nr:hypothetical protein [Ramlibacter sp.]
MNEAAEQYFALSAQTRPAPVFEGIEVGDVVELVFWDERVNGKRGTVLSRFGPMFETDIRAGTLFQSKDLRVIDRPSAKKAEARELKVAATIEQAYADMVSCGTGVIVSPSNWFATAVVAWMPTPIIDIDYSTDALTQARRERVTAERERILSRLKQFEEGDLSREYTNSSMRCHQNGAREHHAKILKVITEPQDGVRGVTE